MGNSCEKCSSGPTIYNLSDKLVNRITTGAREPKQYEIINFDDLELFNKLKCIDNVHSVAYGLTEVDIENLIKSIESMIRKTKEFCPNIRVLECYRRYPTCSLKCSEEAVMFEDCVDYMRVVKLKEFLTKIDETAKAEKVAKAAA